MIRPQVGKLGRSEMVAVLGTPCAIPPRNNNGDSSVTFSDIYFFAICTPSAKGMDVQVFFFGVDLCLKICAKLFFE
jgi:hypothetical protein